MTARNDEIEYLRAVAILLTLFQHLPILLPWPNPPAWIVFIYDHAAFWGGVDLFFVISGFVVTQSLLRGASATDGTITWTDAKRFWIRRAFRLFPLAWFWVAAVLLANAFFNHSGAFGTLKDNASQALWIMLYVYNFFAYPLFAAGVNIAPLGVYWSLAVEEQFYLLLPLLLLALKFRGLRFLMIVAIAAQFFLWRPAPWIEPWWGLRFDALAWGVLLAWFIGTPKHKSWSPDFLASNPIRWIVNSALIAGIVFLPVMLFKQAAGTALLAIVCLIYVWLASYQRGLVLPVAHLRPLLLWLGSRSYAIYVIHVPAFMLVNEIAWHIGSGTPSKDWSLAPIQVLAGVSILLILVELCHRLLEQPLRNFGRKLSEKIN
ncbi:MAG: acyltransferase [Betaproteobacteria bacterium]|nr:acyltransferase [Betaproteobacteria bacterium]